MQNDYAEFKASGKLVSKYLKKGAMTYVYTVHGTEAVLNAYREMQEASGYLRHLNGDEDAPMLAFSKQTMGQKTVSIVFRANSTGASFRDIKHLDMQRAIAEYTVLPEMRSELAKLAAGRIIDDIMGTPAPAATQPLTVQDAPNEYPAEEPEAEDDENTSDVDETASELQGAEQDD